MQNFRKIEYGGRSRVPDRRSDRRKTIGEVKNVKYQYFSRQLRDMAAWARQNGYSFTLHVNRGAVLSKTLLDARHAGLLIIRRY